MTSAETSGNSVAIAKSIRSASGRGGSLKQPGCRSRKVRIKPSAACPCSDNRRRCRCCHDESCFGFFAAGGSGGVAGIGATGLSSIGFVAKLVDGTAVAWKRAASSCKLMVGPDFRLLMLVPPRHQFCGDTVASWRICPGRSVEPEPRNISDSGYSPFAGSVRPLLPNSGRRHGKFRQFRNCTPYLTFQLSRKLPYPAVALLKQTLRAATRRELGRPHPHHADDAPGKQRNVIVHPQWLLSDIHPARRLRASCQFP